MAIEHKTIYCCDRCGRESDQVRGGKVLRLETPADPSGLVYTAVTIGGDSTAKDRFLCGNCVDVLESFLRPEPDFTAGPEHPFPIPPCAQGCPACAAIQNTGGKEPDSPRDYCERGQYLKDTPPWAREEGKR